MEIQGIKILRISDLKRFFEIVDFLKHEKEFIKTVGNPITSIFFDNETERNIFVVLREWMTGRSEIPAVFKNDYKELVVKFGNKDMVFMLGRLYPEVLRYQGKLKTNDLLGITLLYIMLGAEKDVSEIPLQYNIFAATKIDTLEEEIIPCFADKTFDASASNNPNYPLTRHIIVNRNLTESIKISVGTKCVKLEPGECVIGIWDNNKCCFKLLPNQIEDAKNGVFLRLKFNKNTNISFLEKTSRNRVENIAESVCSIALEGGGLPVYLTMDGKLHYDENNCFILGQKHQIFQNNCENEKLIAYELDFHGNHCFYTPNKIFMT